MCCGQITEGNASQHWQHRGQVNSEPAYDHKMLGWFCLGHLSSLSVGAVSSSRLI